MPMSGIELTDTFPSERSWADAGLSELLLETGPQAAPENSPSSSIQGYVGQTNPAHISQHWHDQPLLCGADPWAPSSRQSGQLFGPGPDQWTLTHSSSI